MKNSPLFILLLFLFSCNDQPADSKQNDSVIQETIKKESPEKVNTSFQSIIDAAKLKGAIVVYDLQTDTYHSNDFDWAKKGQLPASTFKIPNSMIALETGVVKDRQTEFKWDGQERAFKVWEKDMDFNTAFKVSCFPCYREIAQDVGVERMNTWITKLEYGSTITVESSNLDLFWVAGDWKVTPFQQIDFLRRLYHSKLPISKRTEEIVKELMINERGEDYVLRGKTGWSFNEENNNGWFVGYVEKGKALYFFATNIEPAEGFDMKDFPRIRKQITKEALAELGLVELK